MNRLHLIFDLSAWFAGIVSGYVVIRWRLAATLKSVAARIGPAYLLALSGGGILGTFAVGTLNLQLSGQPGLGRSVLGGLVGAIAAIELYKLRRGIVGSTGAVFAVPFCVAVVIGRIGCFAAGIHDYTYGIPTELPWGIDFGDGIERHPVQLYESIAMFLCLLAILLGLQRRSVPVLRNAFYLSVGWYGVQRFCWEFFKPYATIVGPYNLFHILCVILVAYAVLMPGCNRRVNA